VYWADELAAAVSGRQVVNDSKSPSGTVHVGSLRGVVLHDAIYRALRQAGVEASFLYGVDDMDAMDSQAKLTPDAVDRYMGAPLSRVPAPEGSNAANYARHFVGEIFFRTFEPLGIKPEFYWVSELYAAGRMDPYVKLALDRADQVRAIYLRVSHVERNSSWLPIQVICEQCGKIGTTLATDWDGDTVAYKCLPAMVAWARGCEHEGRVSPLGGRAKLPWNLEWAAKWGLLGVTIEGCGKDLATSGGSRDRSDAISREVFEVEPPRNVAYEFLNVGGKKMSTSKGKGAAAHTIAEVLPPEQLRFLFLRPRPSQVIEFDPEGDTIPRLFDEFDRIAAATAGREVKGELPADHERLFAYSLLGPSPDVAAAAAAFRPAFAHLAMLLQIPGVDIAERMEAEKGAPLSERETAILDERTASARAWLESYAPERARLVVRRDALPAEVADLDAGQRAYLAALAAAAADGRPSSGDAWQTLIFGVAGECELAAGRAFGALYASFLGRPNGPRAGWLLASLEPAFVVERLRAAGAFAAA
jgi:lysyl-tRNA synthetase class 1